MSSVGTDTFVRCGRAVVRAWLFSDLLVLASANSNDAGKHPFICMMPMNDITAERIDVGMESQEYAMHVYTNENELFLLDKDKESRNEWLDCFRKFGRLALDDQDVVSEVSEMDVGIRNCIIRQRSN